VTSVDWRRLLLTGVNKPENNKTECIGIVWFFAQFFKNRKMVKMMDLTQKPAFQQVWV
jgi:hypothetical protein